MAEEPTARQVLYGFVAAAFQLVVGVLVAASAPLAPRWWTVTIGSVWLVVTLLLIRHGRRTGLALSLSVSIFVLWTAGAAVVLT